MPKKRTNTAKAQADKGEKKKRKKTPSFVCELPLQVTPADERELLIRLDVARMVYNACLGASLRRLARPQWR